MTPPDELSEAQGHATGADRLDALARSPSAEVRAAVAANASARPHTLFRLVGEFPRAVAENAGLPLSLLAEPSSARHVTYQVVSALISAGELPGSLQVLLATHPDENLRARVALAACLALPSLQTLVSDASILVRAAVARNPSLPDHDAGELSRDRAWQVRAAAAARPDPLLLERLAADPCSDVRLAVALNPASSPGQLAALCLDPRAWVRRAAAAHERCPAGLLPRLRLDPDPDVQAIAKKRAPKEAP